MEKKIQKKDRYKILEPVLFPPLRQKIVNLDVEEEKYNDIGILTMRLLHQNDQSIYKLLYSRDTSQEFMDNNNSNKNVRSEYLKKLIQANEEYFPRELLEDKYKRNVDLTFEEKLKSKINLSNDKTKTGKNKSKVDNNKNLLERKESVGDADLLTANNKKAKTEELVNIIEEEVSVNEENEEQSYEDDDYLMNSEDDGGSNSEEANYSEGGD